MNTEIELKLRQLEKDLSKPLTELMHIITVNYCDTATMNDILEIRNGKYRIIDSVYDAIS